MGTAVDLRFKHPFCLLVAGPTGSGKTEFVFRMLQEYKHATTIDSDPLKVLYCYGVWQDGYERLMPSDVHIDFHEGFSYDYLDHNPDIVIVDDLMEEMAKDKSLTALFTKTSHHKRISVVFIVQNLFLQSKELRTISLNSHYITLLKNARDRLQVMTLGRQIYPGQSSFFMDAYDAAVSEPFSHLIIDTSAACPDHLRLRQRKTVKGRRGYEAYEPR